MHYGGAAISQATPGRRGSREARAARVGGAHPGTPAGHRLRRRLGAAPRHARPAAQRNDKGPIWRVALARGKCTWDANRIGDLYIKSS
jgi:hypothetical protein